MELRSSRLVLSDIEPQDIEALLDMALSNPEFRARREGSSDGPGYYDRERLERDIGVAYMDPARHPLALRLLPEATVIGWAEVLDRHPEDSLPWIGVLEIANHQQRQGYGREATEAILRWLSASGARALRLACDSDDSGPLAFWAASGFTEVDRRERPSPMGWAPVTVLERDLRQE